MDELDLEKARNQRADIMLKSVFVGDHTEITCEYCGKFQTIYTDTHCECGCPVLQKNGKTIKGSGVGASGFIYGTGYHPLYRTPFSMPDAIGKMWIDHS
jgi:hypothetical protein